MLPSNYSELSRDLSRALPDGRIIYDSTAPMTGVTLAHLLAAVV